MITKQEYERAKEICRFYEIQQARLTKQLAEMGINYPIGTYVASRLNPQVCGTVYGYGNWNGNPSLKIKHRDGHKTKCLVANVKK